MRKDLSQETVIAAGTKIEGNLTSKGDVWINGEVNGVIETDGNVTVAKQAHLKADVKAINITVAGKIKGSLEASELVTLHESADLNGDISAKHLSTAKGAVIVGKVTLAYDKDKTK